MHTSEKQGCLVIRVTWCLRLRSSSQSHMGWLYRMWSTRCQQQKSCFSKRQTYCHTICSRFAQKVSELGLMDYALASPQTCAQQRHSYLEVHQMWQILNRNLHSGKGCVQYAGPKDKLDSTAVSQPAIYVASLAALEKLKQTEGQVRTSHISVTQTRSWASLR